jgi:hypothetical protein
VQCVACVTNFPTFEQKPETKHSKRAPETRHTLPRPVSASSGEGQTCCFGHALRLSRHTGHTALNRPFARISSINFGCSLQLMLEPWHANVYACRLRHMTFRLRTSLGSQWSWQIAGTPRNFPEPNFQTWTARKRAPAQNIGAPLQTQTSRHMNHDIPTMLISQTLKLGPWQFC